MLGWPISRTSRYSGSLPSKEPPVRRREAPDESTSVEIEAMLIAPFALGRATAHLAERGVAGSP
jgi:hypothetical protein